LAYDDNLIKKISIKNVKTLTLYHAKLKIENWLVIKIKH